jgi:aspartate racemase
MFPNLENGVIIPEDKRKMIELATNLIKLHNADALVLGCTELPLMIKPGDMESPVINTTQIHIQSIIKRLLS